VASRRETRPVANNLSYPLLGPKPRFGVLAGPKTFFVFGRADPTQIVFSPFGHLLKIGLGPIENSNFLDTQSIAAGKLNRD
jgi:hypothetical protein